jgi:hypothetical protein
MMGPMEIVLVWVVGLFVWFGVVLFLVVLAWRTVKALERIATAVERNAGATH